MDYVIKNGTVCLEGEHFRADVTVREGKIQALGKAVHNGHEKVIDADGLYVCPGGIDAHTHMALQQSPKYRACDDFYSGGVAAACGGTTTILDHMAFGPAGCSLRYPLNSIKNWRHPVRSTIASMASSSTSMIRSCENWASSLTKGFPASRPIRRMAILSVKEN